VPQDYRVSIACWSCGNAHNGRPPMAQMIDGLLNRSTRSTLVQDFAQHFYVCGPEDFVTDINKMLVEFGAAAEKLVFEA